MESVGMFCVIMFPIAVLAFAVLMLFLGLVGAISGKFIRQQRRLISILAGCALAWGTSVLCILLGGK